MRAAMVAMAFYALEISITDWKLANISPRFLTLCFSLGVASCSLVSLFFYQDQIQMPKGQQWGFIFMMIIASYVAAHAHFLALNQHAGAVNLTMCYCIMPIAASFYMACMKRELPNSRVIAAWLVAVLALYLLSTGHQLPTEKK